MDDIITFAIVSDPSEAGLIKSYLNSRGFDTFEMEDSLPNQVFGGTNIMPVELTIVEDNIDKARTLMQDGGFVKDIV